MLRSAERVRSGMLLARGYRYLKQLHRDGAAPCYLTTIADGNDVALDVLTSNRAGLPRYRPAGRYRTFAIATRPKVAFPGRPRARRPQAVPNAADPVGFEEVVSFLASHGKGRQFYPVISRADFDCADFDRADLNRAGTVRADTVRESGPRPGTTFAGIGLDDIAVRRNGRGHVIATMALWDQRPFRQTVVHGYDPVLAKLRPAYNATTRLHRRPPLPAAGETLAEGYVALTAVEGDDLALADGLLTEILEKARTRGMAYVLFGCHEADPLASVAKHRSFLTYTTHTFVVTWPEFEPEPAYDHTVPIHLEVGCL